MSANKLTKPKANTNDQGRSAFAGGPSLDLANSTITAKLTWSAPLRVALVPGYLWLICNLLWHRGVSRKFQPDVADRFFDRLRLVSPGIRRQPLRQARELHEHRFSVRVRPCLPSDGVTDAPQVVLEEAAAAMLLLGERPQLELQARLSREHPPHTAVEALGPQQVLEHRAIPIELPLHRDLIAQVGRAHDRLTGSWSWRRENVGLARR